MACARPQQQIRDCQPTAAEKARECRRTPKASPGSRARCRKSRSVWSAAHPAALPTTPEFIGIMPPFLAVINCYLRLTFFLSLAGAFPAIFLSLRPFALEGAFALEATLARNRLATV